MSSKMNVKILRAPALAIALWGGSTLASFALDPIGTWRTDEGKATVRVADCGGALCATIVSLKEPNDPKSGRPKTDSNNVDASKRNRPIVGLQILTALRPQGANKWTGQVYNPEDGKTYDATVVLENANVLKVQGCVLFLCETYTWTRGRGINLIELQGRRSWCPRASGRQASCPPRAPRQCPSTCFLIEQHGAHLGVLHVDVACFLHPHAQARA